jgi:hypothetical protein
MWFVGILGMAACAKHPETPAEPTPSGSDVVRAVSQDVVFPGDDFSLEGRLQLPAHDEGTTVPAVVLVHGSGPQSRDETVSGQLNMGFGFEIDVFEELAEALQQEGYAVLRYDKRSCGPFNGLCDNEYPRLGADIGVHDFMDDALSAASWLGDHSAVDASQVYLVGHSQGAAFIPEMLAADDSLAGGVALAGNWRPVDDLLAYQYEFSVGLGMEVGLSQLQAEAAVAHLLPVVESLSALREGTHDGSSIGGLPPQFWQEWMDVGDLRAERVAAETRPMLAVFGNYDWNIPLDPEQGLWADAGVPTTTLACVTHALNCVDNDNWLTLKPTDLGKEVSPELVSTLVTWLDEQSHR